MRYTDIGKDLLTAICEASAAVQRAQKGVGQAQEKLNLAVKRFEDLEWALHDKGVWREPPATP